VRSPGPGRHAPSHSALVGSVTLGCSYLSVPACPQCSAHRRTHARTPPRTMFLSAVRAAAFSTSRKTRVNHPVTAFSHNAMQTTITSPRHDQQATPTRTVGLFIDTQIADATGTTRIACGAGSMHLSGVRPSVCPSVPSCGARMQAVPRCQRT